MQKTLGILGTNLESDSMRGFLYACWSSDGKINKAFTEKFLVSFKSLKKVFPGAKVALYTNIEFENTFGIDYIIYDSEIDKTFICKAAGLLKSPFDKTIYLDNDILILNDSIKKIFLTLKESSFAVTYNGNRTKAPMPGPNGGLIAVKKSEFTNKFLNEWLEKDRKDGKCYWRESQKIWDYDDQRSIFPLYRKHFKEFHILPSYYNYRPCIIGNNRRDAVICHSNLMSTKKVTDEIIKILKEHEHEE
jgi:hypothetical protein